MSYTALTLDTEVIVKNGFSFNKGYLACLKHIKNTNIKFLITDIVASEIKSQLTEKIMVAKSGINKSIKNANKYGLIDENSSQRISNNLIEIDVIKLAESLFNDFLTSTGAEIVIVNNENVEVSAVVDMYFKKTPPFSDRKKSEFPDALSLLALTRWAEDNSTKLLAVSSDKDWEKYVEKSPVMGLVHDLEEAFYEFMLPTPQAEYFCKELYDRLKNREPEEFFEYIEESLQSDIDVITMFPNATSSFYFEPSYIEPNFEEFSFIENNEHHMITPISQDEESLFVKARVNISIIATAEFTLSVRDGVDKDYVEMGRSHVSNSYDFDTNIILEFHGNFKDKDKYDFDLVQLIDVELVDGKRTHGIEFGELTPDWL